MSILFTIYRLSKYKAHELFKKVEKSFKNCVGCGSILEVLLHKLENEFMQTNIQSTLDTWNFKGLGKICRVISSSR